jgi:hypothetical protein
VLAKARAAVGKDGGWDSGITSSSSSNSSSSSSDDNGNDKPLASIVHINNIHGTTVNSNASDSDLIDRCWLRWEQTDNECVHAGLLAHTKSVTLWACTCAT